MHIQEIIIQHLGDTQYTNLGGLLYLLCLTSYLRVSNAVKRNHDHGNCNKGKYLTEVLGLQFRDFVRYRHYEKQGSM